MKGLKWTWVDFTNFNQRQSTQALQITPPPLSITVYVSAMCKAFYLCVFKTGQAARSCISLSYLLTAQLIPTKPQPKPNNIGVNQRQTIVYCIIEYVTSVVISNQFV